MPNTSPEQIPLEQQGIVSDEALSLLNRLKTTIQNSDEVKSFPSRWRSTLLRRVQLMSQGLLPSKVMKELQQEQEKLREYLPGIYEFQELLKLEKMGHFSSPYQIPDSFYYTTKTSKTAFTRVQTGLISINQLIHARPDYWILPAATGKKKKTLILADLNCDKWPKIFIDWIKHLISEKYVVYVWENDQLKPLILRDDNSRPAQTMPDVDKIQLEMTRLKMSKDSVQILDEYGIQCLIDGTSYPTPLRLSLRGLKELLALKGQDQYLRYLEGIKRTSVPVCFIRDVSNEDLMDLNDPEMLKIEGYNLSMLLTPLQEHFPLADWITTEGTATEKPAFSEFQGAPSSSSASVTAPRDIPDHNPDVQSTFKPTPPDAKFAFTGKHQAKDQNMIVEKFSQFIDLTQHNKAIIPQLQDGICNALTHFSLEFTPAEWDGFIEDLQAWNGRRESLSDALQSRLHGLLGCVHRHQLSHSGEQSTYLGDGLQDWLLQIPEDSHAIVANPWHAIIVKHLKNDQWWVYDPNWPKGAKTVAGHEVPGLVGSIGNLLSVETVCQPSKPLVNNPQAFLREGGLLSLANVHIHNASELINNIPADIQCSVDDLKGFFLRNMKGLPAWVRALQNPLTASLTWNLLQQLYQANPAYFNTALQDSMEVMGPFDKHALIDSIINLIPEDKAQTSLGLSRSLAIELIRQTPETHYYESRLKTWHNPADDATTLLAYSQQCLQADAPKNRLIQVTSSDDATALRFALERYANETQRPVFYIHSPEDLVCQTPYIVRDGKQGTLRKGPGGPLYDFLTTHPGGHGTHNPVLIVNYDQFTAEDIVRLNSLIDKERRIDNTAIPEHFQLIGIFNTNKKDCYQGSDFYSRFTRKESCPIDHAELKEAIPVLDIVEESASTSQSTMVINLFNALDWKERLLGQWVLDGKKLRFKKGPLANFNASQLVLQNAPWEDPAFQRFWQEARLRGKIDYEGLSIPIPADFQLIKGSGYDWNALRQRLALVSDSQEAATSSAVLPTVLNPMCLQDFFQTYRYQDADHTLTRTHGLIRSAKENGLNTLAVHLTRSLAPDDWALLLTTCQTHNIVLQVSCAPGVTLPVELASPAMSSTELPTPAWHGEISPLISSTDVDTTVAMLARDASDWHILDVSECLPGDLLEDLRASFDNDQEVFVFNQRASMLRQALLDGKRIILKGRFSTELQDLLASFLLERQRQYPKPGELVLVTDNNTAFQYLPQQHHSVSQSDKLSCLGAMPELLQQKISPFLQNESLAKLKARCRLWQRFPDALSDKAWEGIHNLKGLLAAPAPFNPATSEADAQAFIAARILQVDRMLEHNPFVVLTGLSGVGKSTFVRQQLIRAGDKLYQGENLLEAWAADTKTPGRKILFIDEANLSGQDWTVFEGLLQTPPRVLVNGQLYDLSPEHKVVFAANPVSYGDERKCPALFERHGNALLFDPLPTAVLYQDVIKPVFVNTHLENRALVVGAHFLDVYRFLVSCSTNDILISPRELQMMALLTMSYCNRHPDANPMMVAEHYAYTLAKNLVPENKLDEFDQQFKPFRSLERPEIPHNRQFVITPSRQPLRHLLDDLLALREWRLQNPGNEAQLYGGLGGITLDGAPGLGKTELVIETLLANGFTRMTNFHQPANGNNPFYCIPVNLSQVEKEALLIKAFHEGAVVVVDEINSSPMMERLLNDLLMGKGPNGEPPLKPGFMVIGTQNPISMAGRRATSSALARRMIQENVSPYPNQEMQSILENEGLSEIESGAIVMAFNTNSNKAKAENLNPAPTFRDVIHLAKDVVRINQDFNSAKMAQSSQQTNPVTAIKKADTTKYRFFSPAQTNKPDTNIEQPGFNPRVK